LRKADALPSWLETARGTLHRDVRTVVDPGWNFRARLKTGTLDDISIAAWRSAPGLTHNAPTDALFLALPRSRSRFQFEDRCFEFERGGLYLLDCREPSVSRSLEPVNSVQLALPRSELQRLVSLEGMTNRPLPLTPPARNLVAYVRHLMRIGPSKLGSLAIPARDHLLDLLARVLHSAREGANDNEQGLWLPLPGHPRFEFLDVSGFGRWMRRRRGPVLEEEGNILRLFKDLEVFLGRDGGEGAQQGHGR